jgi:hypothetical protein
MCRSAAAPPSASDRFATGWILPPSDGQLFAGFIVPIIMTAQQMPGIAPAARLSDVNRRGTGNTANMIR